MASIFKTFGPNDKTATRTLLHEYIPVTGSIISGTYEYGNAGDERNILNYSHGLFQSVYDYPHLSSSSNHLFDITCGISPNSNLYLNPGVDNAVVGDSTQLTQKRNIYNQMAQVLAGYDQTGSIREFDGDGNFTTNEDKLREVYFLSFSRLLVKDEIKKGSFSLSMYTGSSHMLPSIAEGDGPFPVSASIIQDVGAATSFKTNSPAGEYGILYSGSAANTAPIGNSYDKPAGLIFYQAGVVVLTASVFSFVHENYGGDAVAPNLESFFGTPMQNRSVGAILTGSNIQANSNGVRHRIKELSFSNTTELNSTIYFCRANHNEFNYSSNPTYLDNSQIRVKSTPVDPPLSYITTIGLYSDQNELLAVAKLSEPLKKTPSTEFTLRVRLDY